MTIMIRDFSVIKGRFSCTMRVGSYDNGGDNDDNDDDDVRPVYIYTHTHAR